MANGRYPNQQNYLGALAGRPPMQQLPQAPLAGRAGGNPMAAILMGLGGGLSSRAQGGTLGQGFGQGARLGMSMAQAKQTRGKQDELLRRQSDADAREERRLKILEDKRAEEVAALKSRQSYMATGLGGQLSPSAQTALGLGGDPSKIVPQDQKAQAKAIADRSKGYSKVLREDLGLGVLKSEETGRMMSENREQADEILKVVQSNGDVTPALLARFKEGATVKSVTPDGKGGVHVELNAPFRKSPFSKSLVQPTGNY